MHAGAGGRDVVEPAAVLARAAKALAGYVEERNGARGEDTRCWFQLRDAEGTEVRDALACGPVLFDDGDPERTWLSFPVRVSGRNGEDVQLSVADEPAGPDRVGSGDGDLQVLTRTDRGIALDASQLTSTISAPDRVPAPFPFTITLVRADLRYVAGVDGAQRPADAGRALLVLVLDASLVVPDVRPGAVPAAYLSLRLPDVGPGRLDFPVAVPAG